MVAPMWGQGASADDAGAQSALPGPWQTVVLGGEPLPGKAEVIGGSARRRVDVKNAPGSDGAGITDRGLEPARFKVRVTIWTADHLAAWDRRLPRIQPRAGKGGLQRATIYHPALAQIGINEVCIVEVSALQPGTVPGTQVSDLDCLQWLPPGKDVTKTVSKAKSVGDLESSGYGAGYTGDGTSFYFPQAVDPDAPSVIDFGPNAQSLAE